MHRKRILKPNPFRKQFCKSLVEHLPDGPGVYLMYGTADEVLYIGKSKSIRSRVRAHFTAREERKMCRQLVRVEARETAGELGALLLESDLIKQLRPIYNKQLRQLRRLIIARKMPSPRGYSRIVLEAVSAMEASQAVPIMALFKNFTQAKEYLAHMAKQHRLCPALLGLEKTRRYCFAYHLHQCNGACMGEEDPAGYNARLEAAFEERRIQAWPFSGAVLIEERKDGGKEGQVFIVDHWCLLYSFTYSHDSFNLRVKGSHRFDYDAYKILASYIFSEENRNSIREMGREEYEILIRKLKAA